MAWELTVFCSANSLIFFILHLKLSRLHRLGLVEPSGPLEQLGIFREWGPRVAGSGFALPPAAPGSPTPTFSNREMWERGDLAPCVVT